jgi:hypothetical protein
MVKNYNYSQLTRLFEGENYMPVLKVDAGGPVSPLDAMAFDS